MATMFGDTDTNPTFRFSSLRLECASPEQQRQVAVWLQTLCHLGVVIPLEVLSIT